MIGIGTEFIQKNIDKPFYNIHKQNKHKFYIYKFKLIRIKYNVNMIAEINKSNRLNYIDALRGVGIICVVYHHFIVMGMRDSNYSSPVNGLILIFFMPLFFFISGFVSYKHVPLNALCHAIKKKLFGLMIPTIVIFFICMAYYHLNPTEWVFNFYKCGYWFTWVLFWIFLCWFIIDNIQSRFKITGVIFLAIILHYASFKLNSNLKWVGFMSANLICENFIYFVVGVLIRRNDKCIWQLFDNSFFSIILFLTACLPVIGSMPRFVLLICKIAIILVLMKIFKYHSSFFNSNNYVAKALNNIGCHTLEIYFIHYFLLFKIDFICNWLSSLSNDYCFRGHSCVFLIETLIVGSITLVICFTCIIIKKGLMPFSWLCRLCFGNRK